MSSNNKNNEDLIQPQILKLDDDFSLVKRFIDGDESTFRLLVQRHQEKIRNIIYLVLSDSEMVDDIAQEVMIFRNVNLMLSFLKKQKNILSLFPIRQVLKLRLFQLALKEDRLSL